MNIGRKILLGSAVIGIALGLASRPLLAQGMSQDVESRLAALSKQLNLTDDQKVKLKPILQDEAQQLQSVRDDTSLSHDQKMAKAKEIRLAHQPQINEVLTPEQQKKWAEMKKQAKEKHAEQPPPQQ